MEISNVVITDWTYNTLKTHVLELMNQRQISYFDMENVLNKILIDIKSSIAAEYAEKVLDLSLRLQDYENSDNEKVKGETTEEE